MNSSAFLSLLNVSFSLLVCFLRVAGHFCFFIAVFLKRFRKTLIKIKLPDTKIHASLSLLRSFWSENTCFSLFIAVFPGSSSALLFFMSLFFLTCFLRVAGHLCLFIVVFLKRFRKTLTNHKFPYKKMHASISLLQSFGPRKYMFPFPHAVFPSNSTTFYSLSLSLSLL